MSPRLLQRDDNCPLGAVFYSCFGGFTGCCLVDACTPDIGCPKDKEVTAKEPSENSTQSISIPTPTQTKASSTPSSLSTSFTSPASKSTGANLNTGPPLSSSTSGAPSNGRTSGTAIIGPSGAFETSPNNSNGSQQGQNSTSAAVIISAVLGAVIFVILIILAVFCFRKKKRTKVYGARYPSSDVGKDMSLHLGSYKKAEVAPYIVATDAQEESAHQLDSRTLVPSAEMGDAPPWHLNYFELPADMSVPCSSPTQGTALTRG